jgi:hypothetical protein
VFITITNKRRELNMSKTTPKYLTDPTYIACGGSVTFFNGPPDPAKPAAPPAPAKAQADPPVRLPGTFFQEGERVGYQTPEGPLFDDGQPDSYTRLVEQLGAAGRSRGKAMLRAAEAFPRSHRSWLKQVNKGV